MIFCIQFTPFLGSLIIFDHQFPHESPRIELGDQSLINPQKSLRSGSGHITESVVVSSLGELLPQTSPEVRTRRLLLG